MLAPAKSINLAAIAFGGPSRRRIAQEHVEPGLARWRRRAVVDDARADDRCPHTLLNHLDDLEDALSTAETSRDPVAPMNRRRRLRSSPIDLDVPAPT